MIKIKSIVTGLAGATFCMANISGIVTDTGSTPISGAVVQLEKGGQTATTGADGLFTLNTSVSVLPGNDKLLPNSLSAIISGNLITMTIAEPGVVAISAFDLSGKALSTLLKTLDAGSHSISLPNLGTGIYLYKVKSGNTEFVLKSSTIGGATSGSSLTNQGTLSNTLAKKLTTTTPMRDIISVKKTGYLNYRLVTKKFNISEMAIKMIVCAGTVTDADGNVYQTVKVGNQEWMAENLRVTKYNDNTPIPFSASADDWNYSITPIFCYTNNTTDADSIKKVGALYNWFVASPKNPKKLAPTGWHVSTIAEWDTLQNYLLARCSNWDGTTTNNKLAKSLAAKTDWVAGTVPIQDDLTKYNTTGFSALPVGCPNALGDFGDMQSGYCAWWCVTDNDTIAGVSNISYTYDGLLTFGARINPENDNNLKCGGMPVRLLRDY